MCVCCQKLSNICCGLLFEHVDSQTGGGTALLRTFVCIVPKDLPGCLACLTLSAFLPTTPPRLPKTFCLACDQPHQGGMPQPVLDKLWPVLGFSAEICALWKPEGIRHGIGKVGPSKAATGMALEAQLRQDADGDAIGPDSPQYGYLGVGGVGSEVWQGDAFQWDFSFF